jgi:hypothetical protein
MKSCMRFVGEKEVETKARRYMAVEIWHERSRAKRWRRGTRTGTST